MNSNSSINDKQTKNVRFEGSTKLLPATAKSFLSNNNNSNNNKSNNKSNRYVIVMGISSNKSAMLFVSSTHKTLLKGQPTI